jgi:N-acetylmuramic acid 6-phosphate etherase
VKSEPSTVVRASSSLVRLLNEEDGKVPAAADEELAVAIDAIVERLDRGGRLVYVGAGTSGALAALDASELPATFGSPPGEVLAVVADEDADEDDRAAATNALLELPLRPEDCVVAVSASVLAALEVARAVGALCVVVASVRGSEAAALAEHEVAWGLR